MNYKSIIKSIQNSLTVDLLSKEWKQKHFNSGNKLCGHCYIAAESAYHLLGGKSKGCQAFVLYHKIWPKGLDEGETHWFVKDGNGIIVDPTAEQFGRDPIAYDLAKKIGFLTGERPSKRSSIVIERARANISEKNSS